METVDTIDYDGYKIKIRNDDTPSNPREWDNLGTMVCFHSRYTLGDDNGAEALKDAVRASKDYKGSWEDDYSDNCRDLDDPANLVGTAGLCSDILMLPLYLYDHGGITMSTGSFACSWDSGQVGIIFITKAKIREEYSAKRVTKKLAERIEGYLKGEVETYDNFLTGSTYGYTVEDREGEEIEASCWGFYGYDNEKSGLLSEAKADIKWEIVSRIKAIMKETMQIIKTDRSNFEYGIGI